MASHKQAFQHVPIIFLSFLLASIDHVAARRDRLTQARPLRTCRPIDNRKQDRIIRQIMRVAPLDEMLETYDRYYADSIYFTNPQGTATGLEPVKTLITASRAAFDTEAIEIMDVLNTGKSWAVVYNFQGHVIVGGVRVGPLVKSESIAYLKFDDNDNDKVTFHQDFFDGNAVDEALIPDFRQKVRRMLGMAIAAALG